MAEDDLDRVDQRFESADVALKHAKTNLDFSQKAMDVKFETRTDRLEAKVDRVEDAAEAEVAGLRKVLVGVLVSTLTLAIAIVAQVLIARGGS